ncbi:unnamed protein product, partial [Symbiodinium natans]
MWTLLWPQEPSCVANGCPTSPQAAAVEAMQGDMRLLLNQELAVFRQELLKDVKQLLVDTLCKPK